MSSESRRPYRKRRRAEHEAQTRRRITEAAVKLHGTVGPARTTITRIAAEAGVQRATVYRHFPDTESLFSACSAHWANINSPPDSASWRAIADPTERLRYALDELYQWYEWAQPMLTNVFRDVPVVPAMAGAFAHFQDRFAALHTALLHGRRAQGRARHRLVAAIGHALEFATWQSLTQAQGLRRPDAVDLMIALVAAAGSSPTAPPSPS